MYLLSRIRNVALATLLLLLLGFGPDAWGQASPYRGLWVGTVILDSVNEVSIPLDQDNVPRATDPRVPTSSFDLAHLRVILHVNGAGQVNLLKDVAILNRHELDESEAVARLFAEETDVALITDPRMYATFPPQPAVRIASAVFDFGDASATDALDVMVEEVAQIAVNYAFDDTLTLDTQADRLAAREAIVAQAAPVLADIVNNANVASSFADFLSTFDSTAVDQIVANPSGLVVSNLLVEAEALRDASFYGDTRGIEMVHAVVAAVQSAAPGDASTDAHNTAAAFADVMNEYQRFISGKVFGDMILAAAIEAVAVADLSEAAILSALRATDAAVDAQVRAIQIKVQAYNDTRGESAVDAVLAAMASAAFVNSALSDGEIQALAEQAGRAVLADWVARYPVPVTAPTLDYNQFVESATFTGVPDIAAEAAARAAIDERATNPLYTEWSIYVAARIAAADALDSAYGTAARVMRTELPLSGTFAPGAGDARRSAELTQPTDLDAAGLEGRIYLPANHPTNPFRHRRHPDHRRGFNVERHVRFDFDGVLGDPLESAGYGVDKITGTYREEIFGLHKPLGPEPESNPIGLRTEGRFELNRISFIDTLNTR